MKYTQEDIKKIRQGRKRFAAMGITYFMGVFNDNLFKQTALLMAVAAGMLQLQGYATVIFTLPYLIAAAPAGWMADRFEKRKVIIWSKTLELAAMIAGAAGIIYGNWILIFIMLGIMGLQSAIFSPSLNGSIPEMYPSNYVTTANAYVRLITTAAIFMGIASAGIVLGMKIDFAFFSSGKEFVAFSVFAVALAGLIFSFGVPAGKPADPDKKFPWKGPFETLLTLYRIRKDRMLAVTIVSNVFLWFCGSMMTMIINPLGMVQFGMTEAHTSYLNVALLAGIAAGGVISSRIAVGEKWFKPLPLSAVLMGLSMFAVSGLAFVADQSVRIFAVFPLIAITGIFGGIFLIPLESFVQVRPAPSEKGTVISAANFAVFSGILSSGLVANFLNARFLPTTSVAVIGVFSVFFAIWQYYSFPMGGKNDFH